MLNKLQKQRLVEMLDRGSVFQSTQEALKSTLLKMIFTEDDTEILRKIYLFLKQKE